MEMEMHTEWTYRMEMQKYIQNGNGNASKRLAE